MEKKYSRILFAFVAFLVFSLIFVNQANAEEQEKAAENQIINAGISIFPKNKIFQLRPNSSYNEVLSVTNNGDNQVIFEVYAKPYSYIYSEEDGTYSLVFNKENDYTKISRWIKIQDKNNNYVARATFTAEAGETINVSYAIETPEDIPSGGQYAVLFAHTITGATNAGGIKTEVSPGMVIYGRYDNGAIISSEIYDMKISQTIEKEAVKEENGQSIKEKATFSHINASTKVKNNGNIDFNARGVLKIEGIFGIKFYETPENKSMIPVIPESGLVISDEWENTPNFGIFKATWTVTAGENTESTEMIVFLISPAFIILSIILLTIIVVWIIMEIRHRKDCRSRLAV